MQVLIPTGRRIHDLVVDTRTKINVRPYCLSVERSKRFGVYFIFKSMEQGPTFRSLASKYPTDDSNHPIILRKRSRFTHYTLHSGRSAGPHGDVRRLLSSFPNPLPDFFRDVH